MSRSLLPAIVTLVLCLPFAFAAEPATEPTAQAIISEQFGPEFLLLKDFPVLTGDFNGDGIEDAVFVATSHSSVQVDSARYRVLDPSSDYFGSGDVHVTSQFASPYVEGPRYLLIIHGSGPQGWRAKEPKARFVLINVSFDHVSIGHIAKKKKQFDDISVEEGDVLSSLLYWDGHRYKWQPGAAVL